MVFDTDENRFRNIYDFERDIVPVDSTTYYEKRVQSTLKFTTLSKGKSLKNVW